MRFQGPKRQAWLDSHYSCFLELNFIFLPTSPWVVKFQLYEILYPLKPRAFVFLICPFKPSNGAEVGLISREIQVLIHFSV